MIPDTITVEMVRETISTLYRIGNTIADPTERQAIAYAIGTLEAEIARAEDLEEFTAKEIALVEAHNSGAN
jgi:RNA polymerase-interacting CarD/CdnL/TRCF family regulator